MKYTVVITEVEKAQVEVEAVNLKEAIFKAKEKYLSDTSVKKERLSLEGRLPFQGEIAKNGDKILPEADRAMLKNDDYERNMIGEYEGTDH